MPQDFLDNIPEEFAKKKRIISMIRRWLEGDGIDYKKVENYNHINRSIYWNTKTENGFSIFNQIYIHENEFYIRSEVAFAKSSNAPAELFKEASERLAGCPLPYRIATLEKIIVLQYRSHLLCMHEANLRRVISVMIPYTNSFCNELIIKYNLERFNNGNGGLAA